MQLVEAEEQTDLRFTFPRKKNQQTSKCLFFCYIHPTSVSLMKFPAEKVHYVNETTSIFQDLSEKPLG